jgi:hypothetical protein
MPEIVRAPQRALQRELGHLYPLVFDGLIQKAIVRISSFVFEGRPG